MPGILIADDEAIFRSTIARIIEEEKLDLKPVVVASNGEEAVNRARQMHPDIVLMDVKMPGLDGLEATRIIRREQPNAKIIMLTAYDEFSFAQEALRLGAVDYLLKAIRPAKLLEVLSRTQEQIRREEERQMETEEARGRLRETMLLAEARLVERLLHGAAAGDRALGYLGKTVNWPAVVVVEIDHFDSAVRNMKPESVESFCNLLTDVVRQAVAQPGRSLIGQIRDGALVVIISADREAASPKGARALGQAICQAIESSTSVTATVGIGHRYPDLESVPLSYSEAVFAQRYKLYLGRNAVIHVDDVRKLNQGDDVYPMEVERDLISSVRQGQRQESLEIMGVMADRLLERPVNPPEVVLTRFAQLMTLLSRAAIEAGAPSSDVLDFSHRYVETLNSLQTGAEIHTWAIKGLEELLNRIRPVDQGEEAVRRAIEYIRENKHRPDLKFEEVAHVVHLSTSHLSHLLKEKMGIGYVKYLATLRVEEAKRLLRTTDMTIAAVAEAVGYDNPPYFHRVFRRETGMTPADYRRMSWLDKQSAGLTARNDVD